MSMWSAVDMLTAGANKTFGRFDRVTDFALSVEPARLIASTAIIKPS